MRAAEELVLPNDSPISAIPKGDGFDYSRYALEHRVMSQDSATNADTPITATKAIPPLRASDYLWQPWYAKLWWAAIPVWWLNRAASANIETLSDFFESAPAGFLNVLFFPLTAVMVLGLGYAQRWVDGFMKAGDTTERSDVRAAAVADLEEQHDRAFEALNASTDIHDPGSGVLYVGNALSPNNGARITAS